MSVSWAGVKKHLNTHPVIAVARGSHALYPVCGTYGMTTKLTRETAGGSDEFSNEADWGRVLLPSQFLLAPLHLGNIKSACHNNHLAFSGSWVDLLGWTNAKFPPFTHREKNPDSWYTDSFTWDVDYNALPQYSQNLMNSLENYLVAVDSSFSWNLFLPAILAANSSASTAPKLIAPANGPAN
ncbi:MAG: hypothetical protein D3910_28270 [Candidatus Electrothrix sp. ATG2]|nr:hypothetical protein [Candidatus Electrothrix sp. ATG2]